VICARILTTHVFRASRARRALQDEFERAAHHHGNRLIEAEAARQPGEPMNDDDTFEFDLGAMSFVARFNPDARAFLYSLLDGGVRPDQEAGPALEYMRGYNWAVDRGREMAAEVGALAYFERVMDRTTDEFGFQFFR